MVVTRPAGVRAGFHAEVHDQVSGLVHAGEQWVAERFLIEPHHHPAWEIYLQLHGVTRWIAGDRSYVLHPGHLLAVPPGLRHHLHGRSGNHHFCYAAVDLEPVARRHPELPLRWPDVVVHHEAVDVATAFAQLVTEVTTHPDHPATGRIVAVDHLVLAAVRSAAPRAASRLAVHPAVLRVKQVLDQRFDEPWTLHGLSDEVGLAPTYLAELFESQVGQPPHRYLIERRVARGRQLLTSSDMSVTAIALALGFSSSQHFARAFRQHTHTTPTAFRRQRSPGWRGTTT